MVVRCYWLPREVDLAKILSFIMIFNTPSACGGVAD